MNITYLEHSGFVVTTATAILVFDYYQDPSNALDKILADNATLPVIFFVSHHHPDHFNRAIFALAADHKRYYIVSDDVFARNIPDGVDAARVKSGYALSNVMGGFKVKVFGSTDIGVSFLVTTPDGESIFHAGDLNNWHWANESTEQEIKSMERQFLSIIGSVAAASTRVNVAFFPVDARMGKNYALGAAQFIETVNVDNFFPMHFWGKADEACDVSAYPLSATVETCIHEVKTPGSTFEIA